MRTHAEEDVMHCPYCKSETLEGASKCSACGSWIVAKPPMREWIRAREGRRIAGVCRGLADHFGIPVAALRLLFLASMLFGGWGVVVYLALWIALPQEAASLPAVLAQPPLAPTESSLSRPIEHSIDHVEVAPSP
jgi:phage shock protein PspC (stress-responsive transcriptional regulator)